MKLYFNHTKYDWVMVFDFENLVIINLSKGNIEINSNFESKTDLLDSAHIYLKDGYVDSTEELFNEAYTKVKDKLKYILE